MKKIPRQLKQSELLRSISQWKKYTTQPSKQRALTPQEIQELESQNNECENWDLVQVSSDFSTKRIKNCFFSGKISLPTFFGSVRIPEGLSVPTGLYDSFIDNCHFENCHVYHVSTMSHCILENGAVLRNCGSIIASGHTSYGVGLSLSIGSEAGGRSISSYPELDLETAELILTTPQDQQLQQEFSTYLDKYSSEILFNKTILSTGAKVCNTTTVRNSWIGPETLIDGATKIQNSTIYSSLEQMSKVLDGAILKNSILQWGAEVRSHAHVSDSILLEVSSAAKQAKIKYSIIASNSHIMEGEITSSLIGPFIGFHHQSLLISTIWPEGMGNVGHGANVGSNHTGRLPDQELFPGLGMFFGLGVNIKFPADFSNAPWTLIASGLTTLPQKMEFPFSLITSPGHYNSSQLQNDNQIIPGWMLENCSFSLSRNEQKFQQRNQSRREQYQFAILNPRTARKVLVAFKRLKAITKIQNFYTEKDIEGLGKNFITEASRQSAIQSYSKYLERFALDSAVEKLTQNPDWISSGKPLIKKLFPGELLREICKQVFIPGQVTLIVKSYKDVEKEWFEKIQSSLDKDYERGQKIFDDYTETHPKNEENLLFAKTYYQKAKDKSKQLLALL